jgi:hypothetical protein
MAKRPTPIKQRTGLFFDGSGVIGWAHMLYAPGAPLLDRGTFKVPTLADPEAFGPRWSIVEKFTSDLCERKKPDAIGLESPFIPRDGGFDQVTGKPKIRVNINTLRFLLGVDAIFEMVAARCGAECREVNVGTAKKALAGHGHATKEDMEAAAKARGYGIKSHHEADACAVGLVMITAWLERHGLAQSGNDDGVVRLGEPVRPRVSDRMAGEEPAAPASGATSPWKRAW